MRLASIFGAAAAGLVMLWQSQSASAQSTVQKSTTTFVIQPATAPVGEQIARPGEAILRQQITSTRAAKLDEEAPTTLGLAQVKTFAAGTPMFGVQVPDGWIYCAVSQSGAGWLFSDAFACYQDTNDDGKFDVVRPSGFPFDGVPLFVFQPGPPKPLPKPIAYSTLPYRDGPRVDFGIVWRPFGPKAERGEPPQRPHGITYNVAALLEKNKQSNLSTLKNLDLPEGKQQVIRQDGAVITLLGFTPEGYLRYRVDRTMPAQVQPMLMTLTTSTYYYVVSY
jgi:hypothetical protein